MKSGNHALDKVELVNACRICPLTRLTGLLDVPPLLPADPSPALPRSSNHHRLEIGMARAARPTVRRPGRLPPAPGTRAANGMLKREPISPLAQRGEFAQAGNLDAHRLS